MRTRLHVLISPGFVIGLALLLINDFVLKRQAPGLVSGKLSDFAGLWTFAMFCAVLAPRHARPIYALTATAFVLWKSPAAQPAIDAWNTMSPYDISRVVDYTDLLALFLLPASYWYFARLGSNEHAQAMAPAIPAPDARRLARRSAIALSMLAALFAFAATSSYDNYYDLEQDGVYYFSGTPEETIVRLNALAREQQSRTLKAPPTGYEGAGDGSYYGGVDYTIAVPSTFCGRYFDAQINLRERFDGTTQAELRHIDHECDRDSGDITELREIFEREIVEPLGGRKTRVAARLYGTTPGASTGGFPNSPPQLTPTPLTNYTGDVTPIPIGAKQVIIYDELTNGNVTYEVSGTPQEIIERINTRQIDTRGVRFAPVLPGGARVFTIELASTICPPSVTTRVLFRELPPDRIEVLLLEVQYACGALPSHRSEFQAEFAQNFIERLRAP